jgi:phage tail-like protein
MKLLFIIVGFFILSINAFATKTQGDFNLSNKFSIEIDGVINKEITEISGIEDSVDVVEYKDGEDGVSHIRPGNHKPGKLTVTKDWSNTSEWKNLFNNSLQGILLRKSISVIFYNDAGSEIGRMNFYQAWPSKWVGPSLNAKNSGHAQEKLEFSWEYMELKN